MLARKDIVAERLKIYHNRADFIDKNNADLFVSVHLNSIPSQQMERGANILLPE